jgi:hypothetical protein
MRIEVISGTFGIVKLPPDAPVPEWAAGEFISITRTIDELSIVCPSIPEPIECSRGWKCLKVAGPLDLSLTGVLSSIAAPLAEAKIPIFAISTFETDYILVAESNLDRAIAVLRGAGFSLRDASAPH